MVGKAAARGKDPLPFQNGSRVETLGSFCVAWYRADRGLPLGPEGWGHTVCFWGSPRWALSCVPPHGHSALTLMLLLTLDLTISSGPAGSAPGPPAGQPSIRTKGYSRPGGRTWGWGCSPAPRALCWAPKPCRGQGLGMQEPPTFSLLPSRPRSHGHRPRHPYPYPCSRFLGRSSSPPSPPALPPRACRRVSRTSWQRR